MKENEEEPIEHKILHVHKSKEQENPETYRILTITALNHTIDIRTTFHEENFEHLIDVYEKIMCKIKEVDKNE